MVETYIRPADLVVDRKILIESLREYLTPLSSEKRLNWFYELNPHGKAEAWLACNSADHSVIGSGAIIPRRMWVNGATQIIPVMADFWIHPAFRSLGPALKLQRACIDGVARYGGAFFDLPQGNMPAVYQRLRLLGTERLSSYVKPISSKPYVRKILKSPLLATFAGGMLDLVLTGKDYLRSPRKYQVAVHAGDIGTEFSQFCDEVSVSHGICVDRSPEFLRWRYQDHYHLKYDLFTARHQGRLRGFAVITRTEFYVEVVDMFCADDDAIVADLTAAIASVFRRQGFAGLAVRIHASHTWTQSLLKVGFKKRDEKPIVIRRTASKAEVDQHGSELSWFLSYGDIDY